MSENSSHQFYMTDELRHELARRGFFTCAMVIEHRSLQWPLEDWTGRGRHACMDSVYGFEYGKKWAIRFQSESELLSELNHMGWQPLEDSPVPEWYFPKPQMIQE